MPGSHANIERCIQDAAGALRVHARPALAARPIPGQPGLRQADRRNPAVRLLKTSPSTLLTILCSPRQVRALDERAGPTGHSRPAPFPVTISTCPSGLIDDPPTREHRRCEHIRQGRRRRLKADAE